MTKRYKASVLSTGNTNMFGRLNWWWLWTLRSKGVNPGEVGQHGTLWPRRRRFRSVYSSWTWYWVPQAFQQSIHYFLTRQRNWGPPILRMVNPQIGIHPYRACVMDQALAMSNGRNRFLLPLHSKQAMNHCPSAQSGIDVDVRSFHPMLVQVGKNSAYILNLGFCSAELFNKFYVPKYI